MSEIQRRQFVQCRFSSADKRLYTYHWDGPGYLTVGQRVEVENRKGKAIVTVAGIGWTEPPYETKAILGLAPEPDPAPEKAAA